MKNSAELLSPTLVSRKLKKFLESKIKCYFLSISVISIFPYFIGPKTSMFSRITRLSASFCLVFDVLFVKYAKALINAEIFRRLASIIGFSALLAPQNLELSLKEPNILFKQ